MSRLLTATCLRLNRKFHASSCRGISRANFSSGSPVLFSLPPLDFDMSPSKSEPSTVRLPQPIRTQLTDPTDSTDKSQSPPSVGPGAFDPSVIPPSHPDRSRTIVLCFDGTGDYFDADVCSIPCLPCLPPRRFSLAEFEHRAALLDAQEG